MSLLSVDFFRRDALPVARDLLGKHLVQGAVRLRITEVEAYRWPNDSANHACAGHTRRNSSMWGAPGRAYVYLCYGIHHLLNVVTGPDGEPAAVLIRGCEPLEGLSEIEARRSPIRGTALLNGPGKIGSALQLSLDWDGHEFTQPGGLELHDAPFEPAVISGPRVGIDFASDEHRNAHWRLAIQGSPWVGHRNKLCAHDPTLPQPR